MWSINAKLHLFLFKMKPSKFSGVSTVLAQRHVPIFIKFWVNLTEGVHVDTHPCQQTLDGCMAKWQIGYILAQVDGWMDGCIVEWMGWFSAAERAKAKHKYSPKFVATSNWQRVPTESHHSWVVQTDGTNEPNAKSCHFQESVTRLLLRDFFAVIVLLCQ